VARRKSAARIVRDLGLSLPNTGKRPPFVSLLGASDQLVIDAEPRIAAESIRRLSEKDAASGPSS